MSYWSVRVGRRNDLIAQALPVNHQIRLRDQVQPHRSHALTILLGEPMVMSEQVQSRLHRREDFVDRGLAGVHSPPTRSTSHEVRPWGLVREEHVDAPESLAGDDLFTHEVPALVRLRGRARRAFPGMRKVRCRRLVPARREGSAQARYANATDLVHPPVLEEVHVGRQPAIGNGVVTVVVALDEIHRRRERFVCSAVVGDVTHAEPEGDFRMPGLDTPDALEISVDVAECAQHLSTGGFAPPAPHRRSASAESYGESSPERLRRFSYDFVVAAGTRRSALSQMKSLLLYTASS